MENRTSIPLSESTRDDLAHLKIDLDYPSYEEMIVDKLIEPAQKEAAAE